MAGQMNSKQRTFISHLSLTTWTKDKLAFNTDGSKMKLTKAEKDRGPQKKITSKVDEKQEHMLEVVDKLIHYLCKMRMFPFVACTHKPNMLGIKVIQ